MPDALIGVYVYGRVDMLHCDFNLSSVRMRDPPTSQAKFPIQYIDPRGSGQES